MADLGDQLARLRRMSHLTQEQLAESSGVSVDVVRKLEQGRKHSARLPTLHALAKGLGVELTALLGEPPAVPSTGEAEPPQLVAIRRAIIPPLFARPPEPDRDEALSLSVLRGEIADGWTLYHQAEFGRLMELLPGLIYDSRFTASVGTPDQRASGQGLLAKSLQLGGHLAIRLGKTDLALSALERAISAADASSDPLLTGMISTSVAWSYQRQNRLDDAHHLAVHVADRIEHDRADTADGIRVWGGLLMSAATSSARSGDYDRASEMMTQAERLAGRLAKLPPTPNSKMVSVFSRSSVRIERVRLAVQHARPEEALDLARGMRLSKDVPASWRTWLLLDLARAYVDLGDADNAVKQLERLRRAAPDWMRHHTLAVVITRDLWESAYHPAGLRKIAEFLGVEG